jgi:hypothetical protein
MGGGGGGGLFIFARFSSLYDAIHGWMMRQMDEWMEKASRKMTTASFYIYLFIYLFIYLYRKTGNH